MMVLHVALSNEGWILVDAAPSDHTCRSSSISNNNQNSCNTRSSSNDGCCNHCCQWFFGSFLPSLLLGISTGILYESFRHRSKAIVVVDSMKAKPSEHPSTTMIQRRNWSSLPCCCLPQWLVESQRNYSIFFTNVVSNWGWLMLLTCKSSISWTLGPLAAMWCLTATIRSHTSTTDQERKKQQQQQQQLWNTATSTTATVASSQASVNEWDDSAAPGASSNAPSSSTVRQGSPKRYLEILVHNVAHTDMILSLDAPPLANMDATASSSSTTFCVLDHPQDHIVAVDEDEDDGAAFNQRHHHHDANEFCLCRPRFSAFAEFSSLVAKALPDQLVKEMLIYIDRYERMEDAETGGYHIVTPRKSATAEVLPAATTPVASNTNNTAATSTPRTTQPLPTGFRLDTSNPGLMIPREQWSDVRVRGRDASRVDHCPLAGLSLNAVFFPLLAILLPKWQQQMAQKYQDASMRPNVKQVLILVTGVGTPRNSTHDVKGNSTHLLGLLMQRFVHLLYPNITVVCIHSETNLFRYDENIAFVEQELMPCIHAYRDAHARGLPYPDEVVKTTGSNDMIKPHAKKSPPFDPDWFKSFSLTLSFADGSHARTHAIQASLRVSYRPTYFHVWQLKTFWHVGKLVDDDIEVYSFEEMETSPALEPSASLCPNTKLVWEEMKTFKQEFVASMKRSGNDIANFWLRKTRQPVLAVLLVQSDDDDDDNNDNDQQQQPKPRLYRGTNMEVSMPTGSLCAERNVIGSALADNPSLKREDLKIIAVLQVPLEEILLEKQQASTTAAAAFVMKHSSSFISCSSANENVFEEDWILPSEDPSINTSVSGMETMPPPVVSFADGPTIPTAEPSTPVRRIQLYPQGQHRNVHHHQNPNAATTRTKSGTTVGGGGDMMARKPKRTVVVHSAVDKNPLKPCGACNEWLKKIAGSNPYFKIVTFTDKECNGIYVRPVQE